MKFVTAVASHEQQLPENRLVLSLHRSWQRKYLNLCSRICIIRFERRRLLRQARLCLLFRRLLGWRALDIYGRGGEQQLLRFDSSKIPQYEYRGMAINEVNKQNTLTIAGRSTPDLHCGKFETGKCLIKVAG